MFDFRPLHEFTTRSPARAKAMRRFSSSCTSVPCAFQFLTISPEIPKLVASRSCPLLILPESRASISVRICSTGIFIVCMACAAVTANFGSFSRETPAFVAGAMMPDTPCTRLSNVAVLSRARTCISSMRFLEISSEALKASAPCNVLPCAVETLFVAMIMLAMDVWASSRLLAYSMPRWTNPFAVSRAL